LGYRIEFIRSTLSPAYAHPPLSFSTGQILCFWMIVFGVVWTIVCARLPNREPWVYDNGEGAHGSKGAQLSGKSAADKASERNRRRQLRKKLR